MGVRENKVECYLSAEVAEVGGCTRKWVSPRHDGVPDQIAILKGDVWFVEVKTVDGKISSAQLREHKRLRSMGAKVRTVFGQKGVDRLIVEMTTGICFYEKKVYEL